MKNLKKFQAEQDDLISVLKLSGFLTDEKVESAFRHIPRHEFVPESELDRAYYNEPLSIMNGQTISQPGVVSRMTEWLDIKEGQKILEIGVEGDKIVDFQTGDLTTQEIMEMYSDESKK